MSHVFEFEEIVVGSNLQALLFAFNRGLKIIFTEPQRPFRFDYFSPDLDLSCVKLEHSSRTLKTFGDDIIVGIPKNALWERLLFFLSLKGKVPLSNLCKSMSLYDNNLICSNEYAKISEIRFDKCYFFGDKKCSGLTQKKVANPVYLCYDWIAFNRGGKHEIDYIKMDDDFVSEVWFYPSDRIDGEPPVKDACVFSRIKVEDILNFDYSETMARFKLVSEMEARGMKGRFNGYGPNGKPKHYKFRTSHIIRGKYEDQRTSWKEQPAIKIPKFEELDLLKNLPSSCVDYDRILRYL